MNELVLGQVSLRVHHLSSVSVIPSMFHTHSHLSVMKNTVSVTKENIKKTTISDLHDQVHMLRPLMAHSD
jgi:hypothetical protein